MSCIHYKFKSSLDYNSVTFDGLHLSLADLKKAISQQKRLKPGEFELEITNAQTGDIYKKNDELIAKNTSVIVSRVPMNKTTASSTQKSWEAFKQECAKVKEKERQMTLEKLKQTPDLATASEIDKIKAVIDQSTKGFEPSNFVGKFQSGFPHENYVCKRCGQKGHFITNCPNSNPEDRIVEPRYKRPTGIPSTMLTIVDDPLHPGALLTQHGQFAVPTVDVFGYRETKKERPPFLPGEKQPEPEKKKIPQELLCHICEDLCVDAAIAPCCGTSFCDECLREVLLESDDHQCPSCKETHVSPDRIVANRSMRLAVTNFLNDTGYTKARRRRTMSSGGEVPQPETKSSHVTSSSKASPQSSPNMNASPVYTEPTSSKQQSNTSNNSTQPASHYASRSSNSNSESSRSNSASNYRGSFNSQYRNSSRPPRFQSDQHSKPWRFANDHAASFEPSTISTISRRADTDFKNHYPRSHAEEVQSYRPGTQSDETHTASDTGRTSAEEPAAPGTTPISAPSQASGNKEPLLPKPLMQWPQMSVPLNETSTNAMVTNSHTALLNAARFIIAAQTMPLLTVPPPGQRPFPTGLPVYPMTHPGPRMNNLPIPSAVNVPPVPLSKEEFYHAKKMFQQTEAPKKKPVDVFDSFADFTKRRSRTPERRRSYSRSRSGSWKRHSRSRSRSISKRRSRSLTPRRLSSHSRSPIRSSVRSRSRSGPRSQKSRSRSRSVGPPRLSRQHSRTLSPSRKSISRSRSRSGPRSTKPLSPRARSPLPPLRRSSKSPLPMLSRSRSRSYKRFSRSRSKSWIKRGRSRSYSRPRSSRALSRSPRRSPLRSPLRKRSYSPRRLSRSYSPRRRSPYRSRSRSPLSKRKVSRSRSRSPLPKRPFSPIGSAHRSKSPYKKPLSPPPPFRRRSPSPYRLRGGYRGRGRGGFGFNRDKFHGYHSPPRLPAPVTTAVLSANMPPVPYDPQMGLPPPEEYFKYNPSGYQEFVRNFYAQFGPQAQAWAQNQTFPLPSAGGMTAHMAAANPFLPNHRLPWETVPMSPSHRPRSITPPGGPSSRERKEQNYRDSARPWEKPDRGDNRDKRLERGRDAERNRESDRNRDAERNRESDRNRDAERNRELNRDSDRNKDTERKDPDKSRETEKIREIDRNRDSERFRDPERNKEIERHRRDLGDRRDPGDRRDRTREDDRNKARDANRDKEKDSHRNRDKVTAEKKRSPSKKSKEDEKTRNKEKKKSEKKKDEKENKKSKKRSEADNKKEVNDPKDNSLRKTSPVSDKELPSPSKEDKSIISSTPPVINDLAVPDAGTNTLISEESNKIHSATTEVETVQLLNKDKKTIGKKKGDGVGGKKKTKDGAGEDGTAGEKKGKKTKKKKLTFGSSDVDTKQGLKKKKMKRLVDYKSENCTSEDGEEKASLVGSPLKKAKLAELNQKIEASTTEATHVSSSEATLEVSTETVMSQKPEKVAEDASEATVSQSESAVKPVTEVVEGKSKDELVPELPELSKWERDDFDLFEAIDQPKEKPQEKMMLPRSVVDKAEKFLTHKPMKNAVMVAHVTTSTKSPEANTAPDKRVSESTTSRRVFIDKKEGRDKKADIQITVKTDKSKIDTSGKRAQGYNKTEDSRHRYHYNDYEEDQRSVVKSRSLERELQEKSKRHRSKEKYLSRRDERKDSRSHRDSAADKSTKYDSNKKDTKSESTREKAKEKSPEPKERRHSKDNPISNSSESSKSTKDLRLKLEEKNKSKSSIDPRKLSVMDESEFVPDYEDLAIDNTSDKEQDDATASQNSGTSSPESLNDAKKRKRNEDETKVEEGHSETEESSKHKKSKKKHKHKNKEKKEKHKHKKKKHKHKKSKEEKDGKQQSNKDESL